MTGKGSSSSSPLGKGKGGKKGGKRGKPELPVLNDDDPEDPLKDALDKAKRAKTLLITTLSNYEEALEKVKKSPYLSKQSLKEKVDCQKTMEDALAQLKKSFAKGDKCKLETLKKEIILCAAAVKDAKEEAKELVQISQKALSKATTKKGA